MLQRHFWDLTYVRHTASVPPLHRLSVLLLEDGGLENEGKEPAKIPAGHGWAVKALGLEQPLPPVFGHAGSVTFGW